jgi:hypothetical protein
MGLQAGDLRNMVYKIFEIDSFKSKMGSDEEIVVLSFSVKENQAAKDLVEFIEKGYSFVLDADATSGEQSDGTYKVFVELERNKDIPSQVLEVIDGVKKLAGLEKIRYRYYKSFDSKEVTEDNLTKSIPLDKDTYESIRESASLSNYKNFFSRSYVESIDVVDDILTISKKYADPLHFEIIGFGDSPKTIDQLDESFNVDGWAEIIFLTKYIGDYNISKYGDKLVFENEHKKALVVRRI